MSEQTSSSAQEALIQLGVLALQTLLREVPAAVSGIRELLAKTEPSDADFAILRSRIEADTFAALVPAAGKFPLLPAKPDA